MYKRQILTTYEELARAEVVVLPLGEENKRIEVALNVWEVFTEYGATRHDLIINLGGGLITDMGGFIASCYKRGIAFINIPTSLLGMVDASIGGKTGVNLGHFKNQIGVFSNPEGLYIDTLFLGTLPNDELLSGYAEMLKHGLIRDAKLFVDVLEQMRDPRKLDDALLERCIRIKHEVVAEDPVEKGLRKILNFGHTFGHVIEGHYMLEGLKHGEAVAIGMIMESFVSMKRGMISEKDFESIEGAISLFYTMPKMSNEDIQSMVGLLSNDKKNTSGKILTCLLDEIGSCSYDHEISEEEALEVFLHFKNQQINLN